MKSQITSIPTSVVRLLPLNLARSATLSPHYHNRRLISSSRRSHLSYDPAEALFVNGSTARKVAIAAVSSRRFATAVRKPAATRLMDQFNVKGKVYIVTGGGRGLGLMMAEGIAEAGGKGTLINFIP